MSEGVTRFTSGPGIPILVEGSRDESLLQELTKQIEGEYIISERGGGSEVLKALNILVDISLPRIGVILDLDEKTQEEVYEQCYANLDGNFDNISKESNDRIGIGDISKVYVGYAGLPNDPDIEELSIERHAIEDHILKLLFNSDETVRRISSSDITDAESLKSAVLDIESRLEEHYGTLRRGKVHLEIAKIVLGYESNTNSFIYNLLKCSEIDYKTHSSTKQLLSVFQEFEHK